MEEETAQSGAAWFVGLAAMGFSFAVMLNPLRRIFELKSTPASSSSPQTISILVYLAMFANYTVWTWYGAVIQDKIVFIQNGAGVLLTVFYLHRFGQLSKGASPQMQSSSSGAGVILHPAWLSQPSRLTAASISVLGIISVLGMLAMKGIVQANTLGAAAVVVSVLLFASPLSALKLVLVQKHTGNLDLTMSILLFAMGCAWTMYGFLISNINIIIPNILGVILSAFQLSLFAIFPRKRKEEPLFL